MHQSTKLTNPSEQCPYYKEYGCDFAGEFLCTNQCQIAYEYQQLKFTEELNYKIEAFFNNATDDDICEALLDAGDPTCLKCKELRSDPTVLADYIDCKLSKRFYIKE